MKIFRSCKNFANFMLATATGQLKVAIDFAQPHKLDRSIFADIFGYAPGAQQFFRLHKL